MSVLEYQVFSNCEAEIESRLVGFAEKQEIGGEMSTPAPPSKFPPPLGVGVDAVVSGTTGATGWIRYYCRKYRICRMPK